MKIRFGIVGSGWRSEFYLRIAKQMPEKFEVCGLVTRRAKKAAEIYNKWHVPVFSTSGEMLMQANPEFVVVAVAKDAIAPVSLNLCKSGAAVLAETFLLSQVSELVKYWDKFGKDSKIQFAEQYHLQPMHSARLSYIKTGKLGNISEAHISIIQSYHGISLMRKYLGLSFENAQITAKKFMCPVTAGPGRSGNPETDEIIDTNHMLAWFDFGNKLGIFDFADNQHRSWIRSQRTLIRGDRGEIVNSDIKYLEDYVTPIKLDFKRENLGEEENLEGYGLKGITAGNRWYYKNPYPEGRLIDDEIAVACCLDKMHKFIDSGESFYSLAENFQDQYLSLVMNESAETGKMIKTQAMPWGQDN